jgi:hypothetical protein
MSHGFQRLTLIVLEEEMVFMVNFTRKNRQWLKRNAQKNTLKAQAAALETSEVEAVVDETKAQPMKKVVVYRKRNRNL